MNTPKPSFIINPASHISIAFADGKSVTKYTGDPVFDPLIEAIKAADWDRAYELVTDPVTRITSAVTALSDNEQDVRVEHGLVYVGNEVVHNTICDRIVAMADAGFDINPMKMFLANLMENPSHRAVTELYGFLEATELPITDDGHFLAYKKIRGDYSDCHTGRMDNSVGQTVEMPRNRVNDNKDETCSSGLHFCGRHYLEHFGGERTVVVKINPRDVVSIPTDYNNAKGRTCKYVVVQELQISEKTSAPTSALEKSVVAKKTTHTDQVARINLETGETEHVYKTLSEASEGTGIDAAYIKRVLSGDRKSTGGWGWKWTREEFDLEPVDEDCHSCGYPECECCDDCDGFPCICDEDKDYTFW